MPIDYNFEHTPSFRDLTQTGLILLRDPFARALRKLDLLRQTAGEPKLVPVVAKPAKRLRRSS